MRFLTGSLFKFFVTNFIYCSFWLFWLPTLFHFLSPSSSSFIHSTGFAGLSVRDIPVASHALSVTSPTGNQRFFFFFFGRRCRLSSLSVVWCICHARPRRAKFLSISIVKQFQLTTTKEQDVPISTCLFNLQYSIYKRKHRCEDEFDIAVRLAPALQLAIPPVPYNVMSFFFQFLFEIEILEDVI